MPGSRRSPRYQAASAVAGLSGEAAAAEHKRCKNPLIVIFCTDKGYSHCWDTGPSAACCSTDKSGEARDCLKPGVRVEMRSGVKVTLGR